MARSFLSFTFTLAPAVLLVLGAGPLWAENFVLTPESDAKRAEPLPPWGFRLPAGAALAFGAEAAPASAQSAFIPATAASQPQRYPELEAAIKQLLRDKDIPKAIKDIPNALGKYPELPPVHLLLYQILTEMNQRDAARVQLEEAVKANPSDPEPYVILGNIALQERRTAEAAMDFGKSKQLLAAYTNALRKGVLQQQTLSGIAQVAERRENWRDAEPRLRELLKIAPDDLVNHQRLARCLFWQNKPSAAYEALKEAKEIDRANARKNKVNETFLTPEAIMALYFDAFEAGVKPSTGNAEKWFKIALTKAPDDLATREAVAKWALERKGDIPFAKEQAEAAVRIEAADANLKPEDRRYNGSSVGVMLHGLVALWEKDCPAAEKDFRAIILRTPNDFVAKYDLALALGEQKDPAKNLQAKSVLEDILKNGPTSMKPEAEKLYEIVKDAKNSESAPEKSP